MSLYIPLLLILPLLGLLVSQFINSRHERAIYYLNFIPLLGSFLLLLVLGTSLLFSPEKALIFDGPTLYHADEAEFKISLFIDGFALLYLFVAMAISLLILKYSKAYMHRERGYRRFFGNMMFFYSGLVLVLLAGNLELLFVGWEMLGVSSFFLIGFYRERYLPMKNALKVVSLYRIADIALICGIWICHHYFGQSISFFNLEGLQGSTQEHILSESLFQFLIPSAFILAAFVKSAQFPFTSWLPRAMEGPSSSSAIFYGSLSVHIGVFLLIRTAPLWEENLFMHLLIAFIGLSTIVLSTFTARVQSSIKAQIAYSSAAQIGFMLIWVAMGWYWFAMIHFAGNAFLRAYQLLVSPSVLAYRIHDMHFNFKARPKIKKITLFERLRLSLIVLGVKEFNLDTFQFRYLWNPLKRAGNLFSFIDTRATYILALPLVLIGTYGLFNQEYIPDVVLKFLPEFFAILGLVFVLKAFVERKSSLNAWVLIMVNQMFQALSFSYNEQFQMSQLLIFFSGIVVSLIIGIYCINRLRRSGADVSLNRFHGHAYEHPRLAFLFAISALGLAGFPITPTFIGEDLMFGHIHENQFPLLALIALNVILDGLVIFRIYARLFTGPQDASYHEVAYRSS